MHDEEEPLFAPVFHRYGHSLLEYAISKSGALGGGGTSSDGFLPEGKTGNLGSGKGVEKASAQGESTHRTTIHASLISMTYVQRNVFLKHHRHPPLLPRLKGKKRRQLTTLASPLVVTQKIQTKRKRTRRKVVE